MNLETVITLAIIGAILAGLFVYSRKSSADKAAIQKQATDAVNALKATAEQAIDRLHKSVPAAPPAQIAPQAPIYTPMTPTPAAAPIPPQTIIQRAGEALQAAAVSSPAATPEWPKDTVHNGVRALLDAPLSPLYRWSQMCTVLGSQPGTRVADPSNGAALGLPTRSAAGFPLAYAVANGTVVGTPTVMLGDNGFNSDAEVLQYIRLTTRTPEQEAAAQAQWAAQDAEKIRRMQAGTNAVPAETAVPIEGV